MPVSTHTSIADFAELLLYPTPATNDLTIAWAAAQNTLLDICVSNLMGQPCLHTQKMVEAGQNATTISLAPLVAGAYTLTLTTQNGQRVVRKVLKI